MTQLNKLLPVEVGSGSDKAAKSRFSIGTVVVLACLGLVLHVSVLLLVLQSRRAADDRETEVRRREVAAEGLEARRTGLLSEINALDNQRITKRREVDEVTAGAEDALRVKAERVRAVKELEETKSVLDQTKTDLNGASASLATAKREESGLRQSITDLKKDLVSNEQRRDALRTEIVEFDRRIPELKRQATEAGASADASQKLADDAARLRSERDTALNEVLKNLAQRTAEWEGLKSQNESLRKESESLRQSRDILKDEIGKHDKQKQDLISDIRNFDQRREASRKETAEVQLQLGDLKRQADETAKAVESGSRLRQGQEVALAKISEEAAKKTSEAAGLTAQIEAMRKEETSLRQFRDARKDEIAGADKQRQALATEIKDLEQRREVARKESADLDGRVSDLKRRSEEAAKAADAALRLRTERDASLAKSNEEIAKKALDLAGMTSQIEVLRKEEASLRQFRDARKDEIVGVDQQRQILIGEMRDLEQRREALRKDTVVSETRISDLKRQAEEVGKAVEVASRLRSDQEVALSKSSEDIAKKAIEFSSLNTQTEILRKEEVSLRQVRDARRDEVAASDKQKQALASEINTLEQRRDAFRKEVNDAEIQAVELKRQIGDGAKAADEFVRLNEEVAKRRLEEGLLRKNLEFLRPEAAAVSQAAGQRKQVDADLAAQNAALVAVRQQVGDAQAELLRVKYERSLIIVNNDELSRLEKEREAEQQKLNQLKAEISRLLKERAAILPQ